MRRKRYLLLTNFFTTKDWINEVIEEIKEDIDFDIDVVVVGGKVYTKNSYCLCFDGYLRDTIVPTPKSLRGKPTPEGTSFVANIETSRAVFEIQSCMKEHQYDAIVNIMSLNDYDLLMFDWILDSAAVPLDHPTKFLPMTPCIDLKDVVNFGKLDKNLLIVLLKQIPKL